jgi:SAM-dependent methyltransferase
MENALGTLKGKKLLEIGSGYNLFLAICLEKGIKAYGLEPAHSEFYKHTHKIGKEILRRIGFKNTIVKNGIGEEIPFKENFFDVVASFYTLEHVKDIKKVLAESVRVLKPGGVMYHVVPNYGSFWEGHYGIIWPPYIPKVLARVYVKIWGKSSKLLDEIQLVNQLTLRRDLRLLPIEIEGWGNKEFEKKLSNFNLLDISTIASAKKLLNFFKFFKLIRLVIIFSNIAKAQTPIVLIARKKRVSSTGN